MTWFNSGIVKVVGGRPCDSSCGDFTLHACGMFVIFIVDTVSNTSLKDILTPDHLLVKFRMEQSITEARAPMAHLIRPE